MVETHILQNGLRLQLVPYAGTQAVTVLVMCKIGSRYETRAESGVSHFIEHLFFKGTTRRPTPREISLTLDSVGADFNAFTSKEATAYYIKVDARQTALAIDLLSDMVFHSTCNLDELNRERQVILEEIKMYNDRPSSRVRHLFDQTMFGDHPLGWDIAGTPETMTGMSRESVLDYRARAYRPDRMVVTIAGKIDPETLAWAKEAFGQETSAPHVWSYLPPVLASEPKLTVEHRDIEQAQLMIGFPAFGMNDPRRPILDCLMTLLGGTMSSRLFLSIREQKGLAYGIRSSASYHEDTGTVEIWSGLNRERIALAYQTILQELSRVKKEGIEPAELDMAKQYIRGQLLLSLEDSFQQADWFANESLFAPQVKSPEERLAELEGVTKEAVEALARELFVAEKMVVTAVGPFGSQEVFADEVGWSDSARHL